MISFDQARRIVLEQAIPLGTEELSLDFTSGRFLAEDIAAPFDVPRFDHSAVDGFAVRIRDIARASREQPVILRVAGIARAGHAGAAELGLNEAIKIFTGARLPAGTEAIIMKEDCNERGDEVIIFRSAAKDENIRRCGREFKAGQIALSKGSRITPPAAGLLASLGYVKIPVGTTPAVTVIVTGDELTAPGELLRDDRIYDSNTSAMLFACRALGITRIHFLRAADDLGVLTAELRSAAERSDIVLTVGGVSVGDFDFVKDALHDLKAVVHFDKVAMKPGKPNVFASIPDHKLVFGLPGNPVSALVSFHQFIKPAIMKMMGAADVAPVLINAVLAQDLRKRAGRLELVRASFRVESGVTVAIPASGQESHMLGSLCGAHALIHFPAEAEHLRKGETVTVELLQWT